MSGTICEAIFRCFVKPPKKRLRVTDHGAPIRDIKKKMGLYPYIDERKTERALGSKHDHDLLQSDQAHGHF